MNQEQRYLDGSLCQGEGLEGEGWGKEEESTKETEERTEKVRNLENTAIPLFFPSPTWPRTGEPKRTYLKKITNTKCEMLQRRWDRRVRFGNKDVTGGSVEERERKTVCNELKGRTVKADNSFQEIWL